MRAYPYSCRDLQNITPRAQHTRVWRCRYFLDDVLSAVDAHTGKFLFERTLLGLVRRGKTVVLATHSWQLLVRPEVTRVAVIRGGALSCCGPWRDVRAAAGDLIARFATETAAETGPFTETASDEGGGGGVAAAAAAAAAAEIPEPREEEEEEEEEEAATAVGPASANMRVAEAVAALREVLAKFEGRTVDGSLAVALTAALTGEGEGSTEHRREGDVAWADFQVYLGALGASAATAVLLAVFVVAEAGLGISGNVWLSVWSDDGGASPAQERVYLEVYVALGCCGALAAALKILALTLGSLEASRQLHGRMLARLLAAPLAWFDSTPSGSALNHFLQDLGAQSP